MNIAGYNISAYVPDFFRLDGGAMFGSVPKVLWSRLIPADEQNRIRLACRVLVLEGRGKKILVDLGLGRKWTEREKSNYAIEYHADGPIEAAITGVTDVILTHLHFDHTGGVSRKNSNGMAELTYPQAKFYLQADHLERAKNPGPRERASFIPDNVDVVDKAQASGNLELTKDGQQIFENVSVHCVHGHTRALQWVKLTSPSQVVVFPADLIPTSHHVGVPYLMGYDLCAETTIREKEEFLRQAADEQWTIVLEHDDRVPAIRVKKDAQGKFVVSERLEFPDYVK